MFKKAFSIILVLSVTLVSCPGWSDSLWRRVDDRLDVSGSKTYSLQSLSVDGNDDMFYDDNYAYSGKYRNETNLTVTGSLFSGLSVTATLSNNRWNPNDRTMAFNYDKGTTKASFGDITASLTGNELISFSKRLRGGTITREFGFGSITAIASRTKAATKTVTISGNNTPGPYYLGASQIVDGSERVKIDEREITRSDSSGMSNYTFDAFSGIITFRDGLIIPSTSTITISFETQSYNSTAGTLWGLRADVPVGKTADIGLTHINQQSSRGSDQYKQITEPFHGNNALSLPYELLYIPLEGSLSVKVDGIPQLQGTDYSINYPLHYILFTRTIPSTSTILVAYIPKPEHAVSSDRSVSGLDAKVKVSDNLTLTGHLARSSSDYTGVGDGGNAMSLKAAGKYGKLDFTANLRSIDESFAPIEAVGFFRNERGGSVDLRYAFNDSLNWFTRLDRFRRPNYRTLDGDAGQSITTTQSVHGFEWKDPKKPQVRLTRSETDSSDGADWQDRLTSDSLTMNWTVKKLTMSGELSRSSRTGSYLSLADGSLARTENSSDTSRLSLRYMPGEKLSLIADVAGSKITNSNGSTSDAKNYQLTANFRPFKNVSLNTVYRVADSGGNYSSSYGGYTGIGSGYGYGGYPVGGYMPSYGLKQVSRIVSLGWSPSSKFSLDTSYNYSYGEGENNTNTSISGMDIGFSYSPLEILSLRGHLSTQDGSFIGYGGDMSSRIRFLTLSVGPYHDYDLDINYQKMLSGTRMGNLNPSDPLYAYQNSAIDMNSIGAVLRRNIGNDRYVVAEYLSSTASGLIANKKSVLSVGVEYPLNQILALKVDWRFINYDDDRTPSNNYRANMINAQIGARFR